jgi:hypothetical protein
LSESGFPGFKDLSSDLTELLQKRYALNPDSENVENVPISRRGAESQRVRVEFS